MKKFIFIIFLLCLTAGISAQQIPTKEELLQIMHGEDPSSLPFLQELKAEAEKRDSINTALYINLVNAIGIAYTNAGDYIKADSILYHSIARISQYTTPNMNIRFLYQTYGLVHFYINDFLTAKVSLEYAKSIYEETNDDSSYEYAKCLGNLALIYFQMEDLLNAKLFYDTAGEVYKSSGHTMDSFDSSESLLFKNNGAMIAFKTGYKEEAEQTFKRVIEASKTIPGSELAKILATMNLVYSLISKEAFEEGLKYCNDIYSDEMPFIHKHIILQDILFIQWYLKNSDAVSGIQVYNKLIRENIYDTFTSFTRSERENYWNSQSMDLTTLNNMLAGLFPKNEILAEVYNNTLFTKSMLFESSRLLETTVDGSNDATIKNLYRNIQTARETLRDVSKLTLAQIGEIRQSMNVSEKQIYKLMPEYKQQLEASFKTWIDVKNNLNKGEAAVEYILIPEKIDMKTGIGDFSWAALIVNSDSQHPELVRLCSAKDIKALTDQKNPDNNFINNLYRSNNLYSLIWEPLMPHLSKIKTLYFSTTGLLNTINLGAVPYNDDIMANKLNLIQVSSTADIQINQSTYKTACIYGGINFNGTEDELLTETAAYTHDILSSSTLRGKKTRGDWQYLAGSEEEARQIAAGMKKNKIATTVYQGYAANEESVKALSGNSPNILHLSTHGFYLSTPPKSPLSFLSNSVNSTSEDRAMLSSGLLFAGGNNTWKNGKGIDGIEDGILTAEEISRLDFRNTDIVVMSACESALGANNIVNGVYGLQRGFKKAGVKTIIMSLWKVDDDATMELMITFYDYLMSGMTKRNAFNKAVDEMRKMYDEPYKWAGFIMLD